VVGEISKGRTSQKRFEKEENNGGAAKKEGVRRRKRCKVQDLGKKEGEGKTSGMPFM